MFRIGLSILSDPQGCAVLLAERALMHPLHVLEEYQLVLLDWPCYCVIVAVVAAAAVAVVATAVVYVL